jgi:hydroxymethylbilane synthase
MLTEVNPGLETEIIVIRTEGDKVLDTSLSIIGGKGVFTKEIEEALIRCDIDIAVHSLKDLPTQLPPGLTIGAVPQRHEPQDALIARKKGTTIDTLRKGAIIASGSVRRKAQLLNHRPDLNIIDIRGNVNTRIRKFEESDWDGILLARAGVERLGMGDYISSVIPVEQLLPAVGQGAMAIECRADDTVIPGVINSINHAESNIAVSCERAYLAGLGGGCKTPIAGYARVIDGMLELRGRVLSEDGALCFEGSISGNPSEASELGANLANRLLNEISGKIVIT